MILAREENEVKEISVYSPTEDQWKQIMLIDYIAPDGVRHNVYQKGDKIWLTYKRDGETVLSSFDPEDLLFDKGRGTLRILSGDSHDKLVGIWNDILDGDKNNLVEFRDLSRKVKFLDGNCFFTMLNLETVDAPAVTSMLGEIFNASSKLSYVNISAVQGYIPAQFNGCTSMKTIYIDSPDLKSVSDGFGHDHLIVINVADPENHVIQFITPPCEKISADNMTYLNAWVIQTAQEYLTDLYLKDLTGADLNAFAAAKKLSCLVVDNGTLKSIDNGYGYRTVIVKGDELYDATAFTTSISNDSFTSHREGALINCGNISSFSINNSTFNTISSLLVVDPLSATVHFGARTTMKAIDVMNACSTLTSLQPYAFSYFSPGGQHAVTLDNIKAVGAQAFNTANTITSMYCPNALSVGNSMMSQCSYIRSISCPKALAVPPGVLNSNRPTSLALEANFPRAKSVGQSAFHNRYGLKSIKLDNALSIGIQAFSQDDGLTSISLNKCTLIPEVKPGNVGAFYKIDNVKELHFHSFDVNQMYSKRANYGISSWMTCYCKNGIISNDTILTGSYDFSMDFIQHDDEAADSYSIQLEYFDGSTKTFNKALSREGNDLQLREKYVKRCNVNGQGWTTLTANTEFHMLSADKFSGNVIVDMDDAYHVSLVKDDPYKYHQFLYKKRKPTKKFIWRCYDNKSVEDFMNNYYGDGIPYEPDFTDYYEQYGIYLMDHYLYDKDGKIVATTGDYGNEETGTQIIQWYGEPCQYNLYPIQAYDCDMTEDVDLQHIVKLGDNCQYLSPNAFYSCLQISSINLCGVQHIYENAFKGCDQLMDLSAPNMLREQYDDDWGIENYDCMIHFKDGDYKRRDASKNGYIKYVNNNELSILPYDASVTSFGYWSGAGDGTVQYAKVPDNVTFLEASCFTRCSNMEQLNIGNVTDGTAARVAYGCGKLSSFTANKLQHAGNGFLQSAVVKELYLPELLSCSSSWPFTILNSLTSVYAPKLKYISNGSNAFGSCPKNKSLYVNNDVLHSISNGYEEGHHLVVNADETMLYCIAGGITHLKYDSNISVGQYAFENSSLSTADFKHLDRIEGHAFERCSKIKSVYIRNEDVVPVNAATTLFNQVTTDYKIYVPAHMLAKYAEAANWTVLYSDGKIVAIP